MLRTFFPWKIIIRPLLLLLFTFQIFTRILRSLNLPVGTSQMMVARYVTNAYEIGHVVLWVSSLLVSLLFIHEVFVKKVTVNVKCIARLTLTVFISGRTQQAGSGTAQWPFQQYYIFLPPVKPWPLVGESLHTSFGRLWNYKQQGMLTVSQLCCWASRKKKRTILH